MGRRLGTASSALPGTPWGGLGARFFPQKRCLFGRCEKTISFRALYINPRGSRYLARGMRPDRRSAPVTARPATARLDETAELPYPETVIRSRVRHVAGRGTHSGTMN